MSVNEQTLKDLSVEDLKALLEAKQNTQLVFKDIDSKGKPKSTLLNFETLFAHYKVSIRYNEMSKEIEIEIPDFKSGGDLYNNAVLAKLRDLAIQNELSPTELQGYVDIIADTNQYHPVRDWIDSINWDGKDRLPAYYNSIELDTANPMKETMMRKWALSLVGALYHPDFRCEGVLTFSGKQGIGKTTWIEELIPKQYQNIWNKDAVALDVNNKDSMFKALGYWITELGELGATFSKSDIESLKGFITEKTDVMRNPYDRKANKYPRRTVFYATVNDDEFLRDSQNRRFWVLAVRSFNLGMIEAGQFWAQMKLEYLKIRDKIMTGADRKMNKENGWFMTPDERERMAPLQERFKTAEPIEEKIAVSIKPYNEPGHRREALNATEILERCGRLNPSQSDCVKAGKALRKMGFTPNSRKQYEVEFYNSGSFVFEEPKISVKVLEAMKKR